MATSLLDWHHFRHVWLSSYTTPLESMMTQYESAYIRRKKKPKCFQRFSVWNQCPPKEEFCLFETHEGGDTCVGGGRKKIKERKGKRKPFEYQRMPKWAEPDAEEIGESQGQSNMPQLVLKEFRGGYLDSWPETQQEVLFTLY